MHSSEESCDTSRHRDEVKMVEYRTEQSGIVHQHVLADTREIEKVETCCLVTYFMPWIAQEKERKNELVHMMSCQS